MVILVSLKALYRGDIRLYAILDELASGRMGHIRRLVRTGIALDVCENSGRSFRNVRPRAWEWKRWSAGFLSIARKCSSVSIAIQRWTPHATNAVRRTAAIAHFAGSVTGFIMSSLLGAW